MSRQKVLAVGFDFANTLAYIEPGNEQLCHEFMLQAGKGDISESRILQAYESVEKLMHYSSVHIRSQVEKARFYKQFNAMIMKELGMKGESSRMGEEYYLYVRGMKRHWKLFEDALPVLEEWRSAGCLVFLASNFDVSLMPLLEILGIRRKFDALFCSQEMGIEKPELKFYDEVIRSIGMKDCAESIVFVGDSYELDYRPAEELGMRPILLDRNLRLQSAAKIKKITSLRQINEKL